MPDSADSELSETTERAATARPAWRRHLTKILGGLLIGLVGIVGWLALEARTAKVELEQARAEAVQAKESLTKGHVDVAAQHADAVESHARRAWDATHSIAWAAVANMPWVGSPFNTSSQISDVVLGFAKDVLKPAARIGLALSPDQLLHNNRVDVHLLRDEEPAITALSADAKRLDAQAEAIERPAYLTQVADARSKLQAQIAGIARILDTAALTARLAPAMMGADGPTTYFMGFQTNAEARGTGGITGGFGILHFDDGMPHVETLGADTELASPFRPLDLGPDFAATYGFANPTTDIRNSNLSSNFPYAAQIWKSMWAQASGVSVDGAIAMDPVALSYILAAVGPIRMADGEVITSDNVVHLTESTAYERFPTDQVARKKYLQDIAAEVVKTMTQSPHPPRELLAALGKAIGERRIAVWSSVEANEKLLMETPLAHAIPDNAAPYAEVVINNLAGNKMDYYLRREITYTADPCGEAMRNTTVTVKLTNDAPDAPLPEYVAGVLGLNQKVPLRMPSGSMLTSVRLIATKNSVLTTAFANDQLVPSFQGTELGHPTFEVQVVIPPHQSGVLTFHLSEPTAPGAPRVPVQPLVDHVTPDVRVPQCR